MYLLYTPSIISLQKKEYLNWVDCESSVAIKIVNQVYDEGYSGKKMTNEEMIAKGITPHPDQIPVERGTSWKT